MIYLAAHNRMVRYALHGSKPHPRMGCEGRVTRGACFTVFEVIRVMGMPTRLMYRLDVVGD